MVATPTARPVINPEVELIVAIEAADDDHVPPVEVDVNVVVNPVHIDCVPINIPAVGGAVTVTVLVAVTLLHPPVPNTV